MMVEVSAGQQGAVTGATEVEQNKAPIAAAAGAVQAQLASACSLQILLCQSNSSPSGTS
jgi:hypothetical protein